MNFRYLAVLHIENFLDALIYFLFLYNGDNVSMSYVNDGFSFDMR